MRIALTLIFVVSCFQGVFAQTVDPVNLVRWSGQTQVDLSGKWTFYGSSTERVGTGVPITVPGSWNSILGSASGWGTYALELELNDPVPRSLAMSMPVVNSAVEVYWNGEIVWHSGRVGALPNLHVGGRSTAVFGVPATPGKNLLSIRVSNWGDIYGGLVESPKLGTFDSLWNSRSSDISVAFFLFGSLVIMALYHWGLFLFRPTDRTPLWFGFIAFLLGLRGLLYGPTPMADFAPGLDWESLTRLGFLTFSLPTLLFGLFVHDLYPQVTWRWFLVPVLAVTGAYAVLNLVAPAVWYMPVLPYFQLFAAAEGIAIVVILVRAFRRKLSGAGLFLTGFVLFFMTVLNDILKTNWSFPTPYLASFGLLIFLVFQSLVLLHKFTSAFAAAELSSRSLRKINTALERFIPGAVLGFLDRESIVDVELGDHCKTDMAVMFVDIRDFTQLSESMSPEENFRFINSYLRRMGPVVRRHGGFVDKYLGDGILALFPGGADDALKAALDLRRALEEYNGHRIKSGYQKIRMGIGVHLGPLMLGTIGENQRMDSTVISDTVNAASRLEGLTKKFQKDILVSGETVDSLTLDQRSEFALEYLDEETVKGRSRPVKVFSLYESQLA